MIKILDFINSYIVLIYLLAIKNGKNDGEIFQTKREKNLKNNNNFFIFFIIFSAFSSQLITSSVHTHQKVQINILTRKITHFRSILKRRNYAIFTLIRCFFCFFLQIEIIFTGFFYLMDRKIVLGISSNCFGGEIYFLYDAYFYCSNFHKHCHIYFFFDDTEKKRDFVIIMLYLKKNIRRQSY